MGPIVGPIIILAICVLLILLGRREPQYRFLATGATGVAVFLAGSIIWRALLNRGVVSFDRFLGPRWHYTLEGATEHLIYFGPAAAVTALVFLLFGKRITPPRDR